MFTLTGVDGRPYPSDVPGLLGGYRRRRIYGRLDCPSALRAIANGRYVRHRVFFADEQTARAAGYRPCAACLPQAYAHWKRLQQNGPAINTSTLSPPTAAELDAVLGLLSAADARVVSVGHGRDPVSRQAATDFTHAWTARGGETLTVVDWPDEAASWLRAARRFTASIPDAWVVAAAPQGWAQLARRLRGDIGWDRHRTLGFATLGTPDTVRLAGPGVLTGMRGASADGGTWQAGPIAVTYRPPPTLHGAAR